MNRATFDRVRRKLEATGPPPVRGLVRGGMVAALARQETALVAAGFHPMAPWWRQVFADFYGAGKRQLVARVGRRGGKSTSLCRVAVLEALHGDHEIPLGDRGIVPIVSVRRLDAADRMRTIAAILTALGEPYEAVGDEIRLVGRPITFRVYVATVAAVSGFTSVCIVCDEVAKWRDADTGANPAQEVLASLRPTMATQRNAKMFLSSSPLGIYDAHAKAFEAGETPEQMARHAPSWVANPSLTEAQTHKDEPDPWKWEREYAAIPAEDAESGLLSAAALTAITRAGVTECKRVRGHTYVATMDPATRGNAWTLIVATTLADKTRQVVCAREWRGNRNAPLDPDVVLREVAAVLFEYGLDVALTDAWSGDALTSIARRHRLRLVQQSYSSESKLDAYEELWRKVDDKRVGLLDVPEMRKDLLGIRRRVTPSGVTIVLVSTPDGRHSDFAAAVCLAVNVPCAAPVHLPDEKEAMAEEEKRAMAEAVKRFSPPKKRGHTARSPWAQR